MSSESEAEVMDTSTSGEGQGPTAEADVGQLEGSAEQGTSNIRTCSVKKFIFRAVKHDQLDEFDTLTVIIPERMEASYGLYVWPCAPILAWYLFQHRHILPNKKIVELGAGTALPGIVSALCGAQVTLSDSAKLPHCLDQCSKSAETNGIRDRVRIIGLTWGTFTSELLKLKGQVDILLGSDCFYDPVVFEDLLCTVSYILEHNPSAKFLSTYQERSSDWSIVPLLKKWGLSCNHILLNDLANSCDIDLTQLMQGHSIHLLEITLKSSQTT